MGHKVLGLRLEDSMSFVAIRTISVRRDSEGKQHRGGRRHARFEGTETVASLLKGWGEIGVRPDEKAG